MVYRTKTKKLAFNKWDFKQLMERQFYMANTMEEIDLIKEDVEYPDWVYK